MSQKNYYDILQISRGAPEEIVRRAYRNLAKRYHPDVFRGSVEEANRRMAELNAAYETLSDMQKRKAYDEELKREEEAKQAQRNSARYTPNDNTSHTVNNGNAGYSTNNGFQYEPNSDQSNAKKYNDTAFKPAEESENPGCLSEIIGAIFWLVVIIFVFKSCAGHNADNDISTEPPSVNSGSVVEETVPSVSQDETPSEVETDSSLSAQEQNIENLWFHKMYTDIGNVEIIDFSQRKKIISYMADLINNKGSMVNSGYCVDYKNRLFGNDYCYITDEETDYYYVGEVSDDRPDGFGAILGFADGSGTYEAAGEVLFYYIGDFKNGMRHGFGVEFAADECDVIQSMGYIQQSGVSIKNDEMLIEYLFNHVSYEGYWKNNEYSGKGNEFTLPIYNEVYEFPTQVNAPINGYAFGNVYPNISTGKWKNGQLNGKATVYLYNHESYSGKMKDGKENGFGTSYYSNGQIEYQGDWENGTYSGVGSYYDSNGALIYSGSWENGDYAQ